MRVIVTRPAAQAQTWVAALTSAGVQAQALPLIDIRPAQDLAPVHQAWLDLPAQGLVIFVSPNAVEAFFAARPAAVAWPPALAAASTGPGTSAALRAQGVALIEEPPADAALFDSEVLWQQLATQPWQGRRVCVVRGEDGRDWLAEQLRDAGAQVSFVAAYRRVLPQLDAAAQRLLEQAREHTASFLWLFSSSQAVAHLTRLAGFAPRSAWAHAQALGSHPRIVQAAREAGFGHVDCAPPTVAAVLQHLRKRAGAGQP